MLPLRVPRADILTGEALYDEILAARQAGASYAELCRTLGTSDTVAKYVTRCYRAALEGDAESLDAVQAHNARIARWARRFLPPRG